MPSACVTNVNGLMQGEYIKRGKNVIILPPLVLARLCTSQNYSSPRIFFKLWLHPADIPSGKLGLAQPFEQEFLSQFA